MPNWKKLVVSGSDASLRTLNVNGAVTASGNIIPSADNVYSLGTSTNRFQLNGGTPVTVTGSGTTNYLARWSNATELQDSTIFSSNTVTSIQHSNAGNTIFRVSGSNGEILNIEDEVSTEIFRVNDSSGLEIFTVSGSGELKAPNLPYESTSYVLSYASGSGNIKFVSASAVSFDYNSLSNIPNGIVSQSTQLDGFVSQSGNFVANETIIATGTNSVTSSNILALDTTNNYLGINQSNPEVTLHMTGEGAQTAQIRMEQHNNSGDAPDIRTRRTRGTADSPTAVNAGDFIYRQNHEYYTGTEYRTIGQLAVDVNSTNADRFQLTLAVSEDGTAVDAADNQFKIDGNDSGAITFNNSYKFPTSDGSANEVLTTDGSGTLTFANPVPSGTVSGSAQTIANLSNQDVDLGTGDLTATDITSTNFTINDTLTAPTITGSLLRLSENGSGLRLTNVGAFENSGGDFHIFATATNLRFSTLGSSSERLRINANAISGSVPFSGSFVGDGSGLTGLITSLPNGIVSSSAQFTGFGNVTAGGHFIPDTNNAYDLGSTTKYWRDLYLSSGSLYINGNQVISTTGDELKVTTDAGESLKIEETGNDTVTIETANGDITLTATGTGNIELDAPIQIAAGKNILSSDGNAISFASDINLGSNSVTADSFIGDGSQLTGISSTITEETTVSDTFNNVTSKAVTHNFGTKDVIVTVYDSNDNMIIPQQVTTTSTNAVNITLATSTSGRVVVAKGGHIVSSSLVTSASFASNANNLNAGGQLLGDVTTNGHIIPNTADTYDLGSSAKPFRDLYLSGTVDGIDLQAFSSSIATELENTTADYTQLTNIPSGIVSSSAQVQDFLPAGTVSGSAQISASAAAAGFGSGGGEAEVTETATFTADFTNAATASFSHNFGTKNVIVQTYFSGSDQLFFPETITTTDLNTVDVTFSSATDGRVVIAKGGHIISSSVGGNLPGITGSSFTNVSSVEVEHGFNTKEVVVSVYDNNDNLIMPSNVRTTTTASVDVTFNQVRSGRIVVSKGGHIVTSTTAERAVTATFADGLSTVGNRQSIEYVTTAVTASLFTTHLLRGSVTMSLPSGTEGDWFKVSNRITSSYAHLNPAGSEKIMGVTGSLEIDTDNAGLEFIYTDSTDGWIIIGN